MSIQAIHCLNFIETLSCFSVDDDVNPEEYSEKVLWLTNNRIYNSKLTEYWQLTCKGRLKKLKASKTEIAEYMKNFPGLQEPSGYLLVSLRNGKYFSHSANSLFQPSFFYFF